MNCVASLSRACCSICKTESNGKAKQPHTAGLPPEAAHLKSDPAKDKPAIVIGISGCSRSGKTWVAKEIKKRLGASTTTVVGQDSFWRQAVQVVAADGREVVSEEEPECTDHAAFAQAIRSAAAHAAESASRGTRKCVVAEGFQLLFDKAVLKELDYVFHFELDRDECIRRRSAGRSVFNSNPLDTWTCENLLWPAHERYMAGSIAPLGFWPSGVVRKLQSPAGAAEVDALVASIIEVSGLGSGSEPPEQMPGSTAAELHKASAASKPADVRKRTTPLLIGITGCSRCGKSWVSKELKKRLGAEGTKIVGQDGYWRRGVRVRAPDGTDARSEEEPQCTDHDAFLAAIKAKRAEPGVTHVIAEGFQLLHHEDIPGILDYVFLLELDREECIRRRSAPRSQHNGNPLTKWACEHLLWPAHERYMEGRVEPLGYWPAGKVRQLKGPSSPEDTAAIVSCIVDQIS